MEIAYKVLFCSATVLALVIAIAAIVCPWGWTVGAGKDSWGEE